MVGCLRAQDDQLLKTSTITSSSGFTETLVASGFNFSIPETATVTGVKVDVFRFFEFVSGGDRKRQTSCNPNY